MAAKLAQPLTAATGYITTYDSRDPAPPPHYLCLMKQLLQSSGDDPPLPSLPHGKPFTAHRVRLAGASLSVGKDRSIVALQTGRHQGRDTLLIDVSLGECDRV